MAQVTGYTAEELDKRPQGVVTASDAKHTGNIGAALTDLTGSTVKFTPKANRRYKVSFSGCFQASAASAPLVTFGVYDSGNTEVRAFLETCPTNNGYVSIAGHCWVSPDPGAGQATYKLRAMSSVANIVAAKNHTLTIEDCGEIFTYEQYL